MARGARGERRPSHRPRRRPPKPMPKIDAIPERVAQAIFSAVKKPDPSIRIQKAYEHKSRSSR